MTQQASLAFAAAGVIIVLAWWLTKAVVAHVVAHFAVKKAVQKWGRGAKKDRDDDIR